MSGDDIPPFQEGQRVRFCSTLDRDENVTVPAGSTGVVDYVDSFLLTIQLDQPIPGLDGSDNQVDFQREDFEAATQILSVITES